MRTAEDADNAEVPTREPLLADKPARWGAVSMEVRIALLAAGNVSTSSGRTVRLREESEP
jgi:hypothetical protein